MPKLENTKLYGSSYK